MSPASDNNSVLRVLPLDESARDAESALRESERFAQATLDGLTAHIAILKADGRIEAVNAAWRQFAQVNAASLDGLCEGADYLGVCDRAQGKEADEAKCFAAGIRDVLAARCPQFSLEYPCHSPTEQRWFIGRVTRFPGDDEPRVIVAHECITARKRERKQAEKALRESEEKYRTLFNSAGDAIFIHDQAGRILAFNPLACERLGYTSAEMRSLMISQVDSPAEAPRAPDRITRLMELGHLSFETVHQRKDGSLIATEVNARRITWDSQPAILSICRDITERRRAEEVLRKSLLEKESLLKEVHHRVKNNLQIIISLLRLQSGQIEHPLVKVVLQNMQNRVLSMALIHECLYRSENLAQVNLADYLARLCRQLVRSFFLHPGTIQLHLDLVPVSLAMTQAISCGLIVNELVSNCLKHAFPLERTGEVRIELQPVDGSPALRLRVQDDGVGLPSGFDLERLHSLGLQLVTDLTRQIGGQLRILKGSGAAFEIIFTPESPPARR